MKTDKDGAPLLTVAGPLRTPTYDGREPVITPRLRAKLTPLEISLYSGDDLRVRLARRAAWMIGEGSLDAWDADDLVSYGMEQAILRGTQNGPAVSTWVQKEYSRRRRRQARYEPSSGLEGPTYRPDQLDQEWLDWMEYHIGPEGAEMFRLRVEEGLTWGRAADTVGFQEYEMMAVRNIVRQAWEEE